MFATPFHIKMKKARLRLKLSQRNAASACGLTSDRWSQIERAYRIPSPQEQNAITRRLNLGPGFVPPAKWVKTLVNQGLAMSPDRKAFFQRQDRPTCTRYRACAKRYPKLTSAITWRLKQRSDFEYCQQLCDLIACDSFLEALYILYRLSLGAVPALVSPATLSRLPQPMINPEDGSQICSSLQPSLIYDDSYDFFQSTFKCPSMFRVDVLRWEGRWKAIELNGSGHDASFDREREKSLQIPITWVSESKLVEMAWRTVNSRAA